MDSTTSTSFINRLPNELLVHILTFLDSPSPLQEALKGDPDNISRPLQFDSCLPLKTASLVCRLWRRSLLQLLFRHVVWSFQRVYKPESIDIASQIPLLEFLRRNGLSKDAESFTLLIDPPKASGGSSHSDGQFWGLLPPEDCPPQSPMSSALSTVNTNHSVARAELQDSPASADETTARETKTSAPGVWDNNWLWEALFAQIDPLRITFISYPDVLASLLSRVVDLSSEWAFKSHKHVLSLSRTSRFALHPDPGASAGPVDSLQSTSQQASRTAIPSTVFTIRDWTALLVNEGSFVPVYSAYEFFHYVPPTLLPVVLNTSDPSFHPIQKTLTSFSYIATFPLSRHIRDVVIRFCPAVEHLYMQMMPRADNFWQDTKLAHIDITDLWLECDMAYSIIMKEVFNSEANTGLRALHTFECGDTTTEEAWTMAMQYIVMNGMRGWKLAQAGHFVRQNVHNAS
ncbi:hypothetical protein B0T10DRAFT_312092 [Thelonectria olida]|uniref:F-box domain-containing protein n=1 Tax=Thelonectria olida TaxID=1576542 RepID=A0A9P8W7N6_9HYPO|nr:hypothetical protein B0T10DRAFT_312092 [Thelonectria olida]